MNIFIRTIKFYKLIAFAKLRNPQFNKTYKVKIDFIKRYN